jgi:hypothetical protein
MTGCQAARGTRYRRGPTTLTPIGALGFARRLVDREVGGQQAVISGDDRA